MLFWVNLAGFLGIVLLAVPALALNERKKRLERVERLLADDDTDGQGLRRIARRLREARARHAVRWHAADEICLYAGYALVFLSSLLRIFVQR